MSGLFGTLNVGKSGMNVNQGAINTTSHNIANVDTEGYTRQRVKIVTNTPLVSTGTFPGQVGTGAKIDSINRIRDTFIDYSLRKETSSLETSNVKNDYLYQVENIFNEPSDTGIASQLDAFFDAFQELSKNASSSSVRTAAIQTTVALTDNINYTYSKLSEQQDNAKTQIKTAVVNANTIIDRIDNLNKQIINLTVSGQTPNDLMDQRDSLLDELSGYFEITVEQTEYNGINVKPADSTGMISSYLIDSTTGSKTQKFSYITDIQQDEKYPNLYNVTYYLNGDTSSEDNMRTIQIADLSDDQLKELQNGRILFANCDGEAVKADGNPIKNNTIVSAAKVQTFLPSSGKIAGYVEIQDTIQGYKDDLDKLAKSIAYTVNAIHSGKNDAADDKLPFFVNADVAKYDENGNLLNLAETINAESEINASNITINKELINDVMKIKTKPNDDKFDSTSDNNLDGSGDGERALAIATLKNTLIRIQDFGVTINSRSDLTMIDSMNIKSDNSGSAITNYYSELINKLGIQAQDADREVTNKELIVDELENSKASISGVSLDEEMVNLIQFQHAYSANAKVISTVNDLLDVVLGLV